jgi:hypothetical protein
LNNSRRGPTSLMFMRAGRPPTLQRFPFIWDHLVIPYERETP